MDRRTFLSWVGLGWLATSLPVALAAFSFDKRQSAMAASDDFKVVGTVSQLKSQGQIKKGDVVVVADPNQKGKVLAVNPTCSHQGCPVEWQAKDTVFLCKCHNSKFAANGDVLRGPATAPLTTYETKIDGDKILVKD
jgi:cytochrome b6-f complex iron-sulfur subunit